jgi:hypothetical protein
MHDAAKDFVRSVLEQHAIPRGPVIEIGGRNINGTVRPLFASIGPYASIDLYNGPGVDLVSDVCRLDPKRTIQRLFEKSTAACVVCCEVLEHTPKGKDICRWAYQALGRAGVFIVTAASPTRCSHSGIDGGGLHPGEYYNGVPSSTLAQWLNDFSDVVVYDGSGGLDVYAVARKGRRSELQRRRTLK